MKRVMRFTKLLSLRTCR